MKSKLRRYFRGDALQVDRGVCAVSVLITMLAIAMLAISPAAGALVDDTRAPQQQTPLSDGNTTTAPENATTTTSAATTASNEAESSNNSTTNESNESNESSSGVSFRFPNQTINGSRIGVEAPRLPNGGFLVVHDSSYPNNGLGSTIGVSEYIAPNSSYSGAEIRLFDVPGRSFDQERLQSSTTLYVTAALDTNDNQQYDYLDTAGAQDVGYVVDGRQAVLSAQIEVNHSDMSSSPAEQYGLDDGTGSGGSGEAQSDSQTGTESNSGSSSSSSSGSEGDSENMSDIISGDTNPIGAGGSGSSSSSNGSGSGSDDTSTLLSIGEQISQLGPLLALVGGVGLLIYLRQRA